MTFAKTIRHYALSILLCATSVYALFAEEPTPNSDHPLPPSEVLKSFKTSPDIKLDLVLSKPDISQPVFINFDERGRLWVVEYRQYPQHAVLALVNKDSVW